MVASRQVGWDQQTILLYEIEKRIDMLIKVLSSSISSLSGWRYYAITTADGVLDENTNIVTGTTQFALPADCDISDATNKPMIVFRSPGVTYSLSGTNGAAFITFSEAPILGDIIDIFYTPIV